MKVLSEEILVTKTTYIDADGKEFDSKTACEYHEFKEKHKKAGTLLYMVLHKKYTGNTPEIFSDKKLAEKSLVNVSRRHDWKIQEVIVDNRFLLKRGGET